MLPFLLGVTVIVVPLLFLAGKIVKAYFHTFSSISNVQREFQPDDFKLFTNYKSFVIIGCSGSGKSTSANMIAKKFSNITPLHLDTLNWNPNWQMSDRETFLKKVKRSMSDFKANNSHYVIDGNYKSARRIIWPDIDVAIYLDYDFWIIFYRITMRTFYRMFTRQVVCNGNIEPISRIFTKSSMPYYVWHEYDGYKQRLPHLIQQYPHVKVVRIKSPYHFNYWFNNLED